MKALTVRQPFAGAIASGEKTIENRTTRWSHRGPLAIHAGSRPDAEWAFDMVERLTGRPVPNPGVPRCAPRWRMSAVIAVVDLVDAHDETECRLGCSPWAMRAVDLCADHRKGRCSTTHRPAWHYELANARLLPVPIQADGALGLWTLRPDLAVRVARHIDLTLEETP
ncbi:ASCH domain-containing protein [Nocardioides sp. ChNu-153]|uniref:ASCH domain-containing protein n=1 Tax=unclassified Nocardioides TaxID=2615069 RepID=UPI002406F636|nr:MULTISPECIES: ASCH domain-containing protein [unclassified Nocardioides]MDF9718072.1 ASCH domain-containing protein [Nocardioides sp. ChNu-99]MDN7120284.1 ASCH domain-containing protein [Nocardioides sp. ChNu-153]